jgi:hypothetical protein
MAQRFTETRVKRFLEIKEYREIPFLQALKKRKV